MERVLDEIEILLPVLGFDVLRAAGHNAGGSKSKAQDVPQGSLRDTLFTFTEAGTNAKAREASDEFVVLAGSWPSNRKCQAAVRA